MNNVFFVKLWQQIDSGDNPTTLNRKYSFRLTFPPTDSKKMRRKRWSFINSHQILAFYLSNIVYYYLIICKCCQLKRWLLLIFHSWQSIENNSSYSIKAWFFLFTLDLCFRFFSFVCWTFCLSESFVPRAFQTKISFEKGHRQCNMM